MELDDLKNHLKDKLATDAGVSDVDIATLLSKRTGSVISKLKRSLWIEILFSMFVLVAFSIISMITSLHSVRVYFAVFAVLSVGFLALLFYLLKRTTQLGDTALPVKSNLQTIVKIIEEFTRRYFQFTMALIPVCLVFALMLGYTDHNRIPAIDRFSANEFSIKWKTLIFVVIYVGALATGVYLFTKWYLRKSFGRYVLQLKECIAELAEE